MNNFSGYTSIETLNIVTGCEFAEIYNSQKIGGVCGG